MKSQDILVALALALQPGRAWNFADLAASTALSASATFRAVERLREARLVVAGGFRVFDDQLMRFLEHGVPYAFAAVPGRLARGVPTAHSAPPLSEHISATNAVVWPHAQGTVRGESLPPLAPTAAEAAKRDPVLYQALALVDALRMGRPREHKLAVRLLKEILDHARLVPQAG